MAYNGDIFRPGIHKILPTLLWQWVYYLEESPDYLWRFTEYDVRIFSKMILKLKKMQDTYIYMKLFYKKSLKKSSKNKSKISHAFIIYSRFFK